MEVEVNRRKLRLVEGDITSLATDAIVNAANEHLVLGAGVAGAISRRGGPDIQRECSATGHCPVGQAVITGGGNLPARHVIHAVGPHGTDPRAGALLASATRSSLELATRHSLTSIAFPAISTGVFGFPIEACAWIMLGEAIGYLGQAHTSLELVVFCLWGQAAYDVFAAELRRQRGMRNPL
jgi:O-acetyl-ADP-ribose deacetylase (regulator of RNase III)